MPAAIAACNPCGAKLTCRHAHSPNSIPGMERPCDHWISIPDNNNTSPALPTQVVVLADIPHPFKYLPVRYVRAGKTPPICKGWVHKPAHLFQVRYR